MEKRVLIRIVFEELTLANVAELEEKLEKLLEEYGRHETEITAITSSPPPIPG